MRSKQERLIITFATTTMALKMESVCRAQGAEGRLIPVPRAITAGCGLAWCAPPDSRDALQELMARQAVSAQEFYILLL